MGAAADGFGREEVGVAVGLPSVAHAPLLEFATDGDVGEQKIAAVIDEDFGEGEAAQGALVLVEELGGVDEFAGQDLDHLFGEAPGLPGVAGSEQLGEGAVGDVVVYDEESVDVDEGAVDAKQALVELVWLRELLGLCGELSVEAAQLGRVEAGDGLHGHHVPRVAAETVDPTICRPRSTPSPTACSGSRTPRSAFCSAGLGSSYPFPVYYNMPY